MVCEKVKSLLIKLTSEKMVGITFSSKLIDKMTEDYLKRNQSISEEQLELSVIYYLKRFLMKNIEKDPKGKLYQIFIQPHYFVYERCNKNHHFEEVEENYREFLNLTILLLLVKKENTSIDVELLNEFERFVKKKIYVEKKGKKSKQRNYDLLEKNYDGNVSLMYLMLNTLGVCDREYLRTIQEQSHIDNLEYYNSLVQKIKENGTIYFLLKAKNYSDSKILEEIIKLRNQNRFYSVKNELQEAFYKSYPKSVLENELQQLKKKSSCKYDLMMIFLGLKECPKNIDTSEVLEFASHFKNNRGIFAKFPNVPKEKIIKMVNKLKQTNNTYYQAIIARHGESLTEYNMISYELQINYRNAISKIRKEINNLNSKSSNKNKDRIKLQHNEEEGTEKFDKNLCSKFSKKFEQEVIQIVRGFQNTNPKYHLALIAKHDEDLEGNHKLSKESQMPYVNAIIKIRKILSEQSNHLTMDNDLKTLLRESLLMEKLKLSVIKEKRRGTKTDILVQKYHLELNEIYELFANNLLLFGGLIPSIVKEIIILSPEGLDYLKNSSQFIYIYKKLPKSQLKFWIKALFGNDEEKSNELKLELKYME